MSTAGWLRRYESWILGRPWRTLTLVALVVAAFAIQAPDFRMDASSDSLVLEADDALRVYRVARERYGSDDYLVVTYSPDAPLFDAAVLADLGRLRDALRALPWAESVTSILDVPLVGSPSVELSQLGAGPPTLEDVGMDRALARRELLSSPLYRDLLISADARTTALLVQLRVDASASAEALQRETQRRVAAVREILARHTERARLHLGGVPMIVADSIDFIASDLVNFGAGVAAFLVVLLAVAFRALRWVVVPLLTCTCAGLVMIGLLGWIDWPVTVVSSNFLALLLIISLSLAIHLVVSFRELQAKDPAADSRRLVAAMVAHKALPCAYTALTTAVAFGSLLVSGIRPVIDFGWMMVMGIGVALLFAFTLFPAMLLLLPPPARVVRDDRVSRAGARLADTLQRSQRPILIAFAVAALFFTVGLPRLSVENRFIDYFRESTDIHRGMVLVDRELGGTTPLDVLIDAPGWYHDAQREEEAEPDDEFDDLYADYGDGGITGRSYWFHSARLPQVAEIHRLLDSLPATGKVLSLHTTMEMLESVEEGISEDDLALSILYDKFPASLAQTLLDPYWHLPAHQLRFGIRVFESDPELRRAELLREIRARLEGEVGLEPDQIEMTGMVVLYNDMLQSLFRSQILTVGVVFGAIALLFALVFRSLRIAAVAVIPNVFAALSVLGLMGWLGVHLDLMTITIAAISIGIGVDDTIHYVHRSREEFAVDGDYAAALRRSHASVGQALFYTTLTVALGFSILALSNFVPTVYFGLLTGLAMVTALVADLCLLPLLIQRTQCYGPSAEPPSG